MVIIIIYIFAKILFRKEQKNPMPEEPKAPFSSTKPMAYHWLFFGVLKIDLL
jgi:hypothetical protein